MNNPLMVSLQSASVMIDFLLPLLNPDAVRSAIGERTVLFSDHSEKPEIRMELLVLEDTKEYIHLMASLSTPTSKNPNQSVVIAAIINT